jgi:hypothetical protein
VNVPDFYYPWAGAPLFGSRKISSVIQIRVLQSIGIAAIRSKELDWPNFMEVCP